MQKLIKSKERVRDYAEVYTPKWLVKDMCDTIPDEVWNDLTATFLEPACVDSETEYFNGTEWRKIPSYVTGEQVLCYDKNTGNAKLCLPIMYIKEPAPQDMLLIATPLLNMCLSDEHTVLFYDYKGALKTTSAKNMELIYRRDTNGFRGKIPTTFKVNGLLEIDEWLLRLAVACNADGRMYGKKQNQYEVRVKKDRKHIRLKMLLERCGIEYRYKLYGGYHDYIFISPLGCKHFPTEWQFLTNNLKVVFLDELQYWDGTTAKDGSVHYFSNKKGDVDIVQFIAHSVGYNVHIDYDTRNKNISYRCSFKHTTNLAIDRRHGHNYLHRIEASDGFKYCFTVPTGYLVLRRKDKIFITGNCGSGNFLAEILERKLKLCKDERDGLKALNAIFGLDLLPDNVREAKQRLLKMYLDRFPCASSLSISLAIAILNTRIVCDNALDPKTEQVKSWGITADEDYIKYMERRVKPK